jgi:predicted molibdopterin-dependent oxidoreductase YjgC
MSTFLWCGRSIEFRRGETIAAALLRGGVRNLTPGDSPSVQGRFFCGIGSCQSCLVRHDGAAAFEACLTPATEGLRLTPVLPQSCSSTAKEVDDND